MGSRFDAILFDAGGVLVLPDPNVLAPLIAYYGGDDRHETYVRAHYAGMAAKSAVTAGESDWTHYNATYLAHLSVPDEHQEAALEVLTHVKANARLWRHPIPGSADALRELADSHVVGVEKPDPRIFDHALVHFDGIERSRIAYVGDSLVMDVRGSRAAGLHPILIDPYDDAADHDVDRIKTLGDLLSLV